jgi:hypothetical protein
MKKGIGLILLLAVIGVVAFVVLRKGPGGVALGAPVTLNGFVAGEKISFVKDPEVIDILSRDYGITLKYDRRGSLEMVEDPAAGTKDFLWPASQLAAEIYRESGQPFKGSEIVFNSPIVLYTYDPALKALLAKGLAKDEGAHHSVDMDGLTKVIQAKTDWKSLGLPQLFGPVVIYSTDPSRSNSGNMYAALLANVLNGGAIPSDQDAGKLLVSIRKFFDAQGFMDESSGVIFQQFLNRGMGDKPIIVGYEAQLLGAINEPNANKQRLASVKTLYPKPTVWSSHPLIVLTDQGKRLQQALLDPKIQKIAWERYGFRSAAGRDSVPPNFKSLGVPASIDNVISLPGPKAMKRILAGLSQD